MRLLRFGPALPQTPALTLGDGFIILGIATFLYLGARLAFHAPTVVHGPEISLSPLALPWYALLSVGRMAAAYFLSLLFSLAYGYAAAGNRSARTVLMPLLDVLQSVPILSFLPVVLLGLAAILPQSFAAELAAIVLIFTSQAWNMTFSFYQSMTTILLELREAAAIFRLDPWARFKTLELPFAAICLLWNSMMSWSGGWFFLMAAEIFHVGSRDFRLPGLGSYLQAAANAGDLHAVLAQSKAIPTKAILMVTHNIEEAVMMADRIIVMSKDPGHIVAELNVTLRHPRHRKDTAFQAEVDKVYAAVAGKKLQTIEGEQHKKLPQARLNALAGLLEKLANDSGQADLQGLSTELILELDDLLPLVEAGELLGFVVLENGTLVLKPLGQTYAEASILARKELLAGRVLRLPLISWIYDTLQRDDNHRTAWSYFLDELRGDFGDLAEAQLDIAINWGRHAELFAYDDDAGELYLEE